MFQHAGQLFQHGAWTYLGSAGGMSKQVVSKQQVCSAAYLEILLREVVSQCAGQLVCMSAAAVNARSCTCFAGGVQSMCLLIQPHGVEVARGVGCHGCRFGPCRVPSKPGCFGLAASGGVSCSLTLRGMCLGCMSFAAFEMAVSPAICEAWGEATQACTTVLHSEGIERTIWVCGTCQLGEKDSDGLLWLVLQLCYHSL